MSAFNVMSISRYIDETLRIKGDTQVTVNS